MSIGGSNLIAQYNESDILRNLPGKGSFSRVLLLTFSFLNFQFF